MTTATREGAGPPGAVDADLDVEVEAFVGEHPAAGHRGRRRSATARVMRTTPSVYRTRPMAQKISTRRGYDEATTPGVGLF